MGFLIGLGTALVTGIKAAGAFIFGAAAKIGPVMSAFAGKALEVMARIPKIDLEGVGKAIEAVGGIVHSVAGCVGVESEDEPEILGAKAEQAEKGIADFDEDVEAYIRYLNQEIKLDEEKFEQMSAEKKMGCGAVGTALEVKAIEGKIGDIEIAPEVIALLAKIQLKGEGISFSAEELVGLIKDLKAAGITNLKDVVDLLEGNGDRSRIRTEVALEKALGNIDRIDDPVQELDAIERTIRQSD